MSVDWPVVWFLLMMGTCFALMAFAIINGDD